MSQQITTAFVQQFKANVINLYQQQGSKLRNFVREEQVEGKLRYFERLGVTAAVKRTTRHGDTPLIDSPHSRRLVTMVDYEWADLVDQQDKIRLLISPESEYAKNAAWALGRAFDNEIIGAFDGTAFAGETGGTSVTFTTANGAAGDEDFSAAALTLQNLVQVKKDLDLKDVQASERYLVISPAALFQLLKQSGTGIPTVTSSDYFNVKALVEGAVDTVLGFKVIVTTLLPSPAANMRFCYAWHRNAMAIGLGKDITTRITERADKSYSVQVYVSATMSATRVQEEGVVRFKINETL